MDLDADDTGSISITELKRVLVDPKVRAHFSYLELDVGAVQGLFKLIDTEETGEVSIDELIMSCMRLKGTAKSIDQATALFEIKKMAILFKSCIGSLSDEVADVRDLLFAALHPDRLPPGFYESHVMSNCSSSQTKALQGRSNAALYEGSDSK